MAFKFNPITNRLDLVETGGGGGGDVSGPGSSTDNAIVRWDGTTGTLIKNSTVTLSDTGDIVANSISLSVPLSEIDGGTNQSTYSTGDTLYASAPNTLSRLAIGSTNQVLTVIAGVPSWQNAASGGVTSVSGTLNRITSTGGTTPVIDISASYVGQASITTLGTISTGTWNANVITEQFGGTAQSTYATGDSLYASAPDTLSKLALVPNSVLLTNSTIPEYATPPVQFGTLQWFGGVPSINTFRKNIVLYDDFLGGVEYINSTSGTGSSGYFVDVYNAKGCRFGRTGTDTNAVGSFTIGGRGANSYRITNASQIYFETLVTFDQIGDGTDNFRALFGLIDASGGSPSPFAGMYLGYDYDVDPSNWICYTTASNVTTSTITSAPVTITTTWNRLGVLYDSVVPDVKFYVNDVLVGTHTTNLPISDSFGPNWLIQKTAGTTSLPFYADYYIWTTSMPSDR